MAAPGSAPVLLFLAGQRGPIVLQKHTLAHVRATASVDLEQHQTLRAQPLSPARGRDMIPASTKTTQRDHARPWRCLDALHRQRLRAVAQYAQPGAAAP